MKNSFIFHSSFYNELNTHMVTHFFLLNYLNVILNFNYLTFCIKTKRRKKNWEQKKNNHNNIDDDYGNHFGIFKFTKYLTGFMDTTDFLKPIMILKFTVECEYFFSPKSFHHSEFLILDRIFHFFFA